MPTPGTKLLQDTLDRLILKALSLGLLHGYGIGQRIMQMSKNYRDRNQALVGLAAFSAALVSLSANKINERVWSYHATGNYFSPPGVGAAPGRVIAEEDDLTPGAHPVVMLSYQCWQKRFGADSQIIDKSVLIGDW
jgi:hypothetical protein